jgi:Glycogen recognition site of AMP-activated protein kinase
MTWEPPHQRAEEAITMDLIAVPRRVAKLQYAAVRRPLTVFEQRLVARCRGRGAFVRLGFGLSLGSLDRFAGWLLADQEISGCGQALIRRTGHPAYGGAAETSAPVQPARDGQPPAARPANAQQAGEQDPDTGGKIAAYEKQADKQQLAGEAAGRVTTGTGRSTAADAQARHAARGLVTDQPDTPAGPAAIDVTFTLPAEVDAGTVALCGEFNNWSAHDIRLERGGDGRWQATVALEPGRSYRYRYLLDGERWENAWQADHYVRNSYGSTDSVVVVG